MTEPTPTAPQTSTPPADTAPAAASPSTPPSPNAAAAADRPSFLPEQFWDAEKKAPKLEDLTGEFKKLDDAAKAEAARRDSLPKAPGDYKVELTPDFKMPEGMDLDMKSAGWGKLAEFAKARGLDQKGFSELATLHLQTQLEAQGALRKSIADDFTAKLGDRADARVTAAQNFLTALVGEDAGKAAAQAFIKPEIVMALEKAQAALASAGVTSFSTTGREGKPPEDKIPGYENMSFQQRWASRRRETAAA